MTTRLAAYINPGRDLAGAEYHPSDIGYWRGVRARIAPH